MLVPVTVVGKDTRLHESETKTLALALELRVEASFLLCRSHRVIDLVFVDPSDRRADAHLRSFRLKLKQLHCDPGRRVRRIRGGMNSLILVMIVTFMGISDRAP